MIFVIAHLLLVSIIYISQPRYQRNIAQQCAKSRGTRRGELQLSTHQGFSWFAAQSLSSLQTMRGTFNIENQKIILVLGQSCKIGNAPNSGAKKSKFMFCPFWMHSWYCLMSSLMEKIICKLKYCLDIFFGGNSSILCPAETLQISRLFGVPACVSTFQPNKTSHNQWNKHIFGKNVFSSWYSLRNICFWQKFKLVIFLESPQISGGF